MGKFQIECGRSCVDLIFDTYDDVLQGCKIKRMLKIVFDGNCSILAKVEEDWKGLGSGW